jgi:hypothetical protein
MRIRLLRFQLRWIDLGRVRVTLGAASVRIRALFADSSVIGYSTRWVWSNEGDKTPTLERSNGKMIPARFAHCQQNHGAERDRENLLIAQDFQDIYIRN